MIIKVLVFAVFTYLLSELVWFLLSDDEKAKKTERFNPAHDRHRREVE